MNYTCNICNKEAIGCYRPDIDVRGLCFCDEHKERVQLAYLALLRDDEKMCRDLLGKE